MPSAAKSGRAIVAVAEPISSNGSTIGSVVLQQGTHEILSLTNAGLARLMNVTMIATLLVAGALLGYATWLSRRIRRLSVAAEDALVNDDLRTILPSSASGDEVGDLSRSFSHVLSQLADYNDYLRSLASKLSHELRTPLAIVTSSLENLEHEALNEASAGYTARAKDGADRLRRILSAMSEASRVEQSIRSAQREQVDLTALIKGSVAGYREAFDRPIECSVPTEPMVVDGSPDLLAQMLDKLMDNAADFAPAGGRIAFSLHQDVSHAVLAVENEGPPLPTEMRGELFESMVSLRPAGHTGAHLGLGLAIVRLVAEFHRGTVQAGNLADDAGARFRVILPI